MEVIEYARFQNNHFWNDNSFIRRENCERFCFYCDLSVFEQHSCFGALCNHSWKFEAFRVLSHCNSRHVTVYNVYVLYHGGCI